MAAHFGFPVCFLCDSYVRNGFKGAEKRLGEKIARKMLTSDFQGNVRVVRNQLQDLLVDGILHRETVHPDYLVAHLQTKINKG